MPQLEVAGGEATNEPIVAAEPTLEDRFAAFGDEEQQEEPPVGDQPAPDAPDEAEVEVEITDADLPPIVAPVSWTAEEKADFAELPRAMQETVKRREAEREKFVQAKSQEVRTVQQKAEQAASERIAQAQNVHVQTLNAMLPEIPEKPANRYRTQNPAAWDEAMDAHENAIAQHRYVQQVTQQIVAQQQQAQAQAEAEENDQGRALLQDKFPEYFDDAVRADLEPKFKAIAQALEYPADQLGTFDAHDILRLKTVSEWKAKADKLDTLMAKKMETVRGAKKLPQISRPGTAQGRSAIEGQRYASDRQAMRSGDRDAGVRLFSAL